MLTALKDKSIGSIIKIKIEDNDTDFILTNLGDPNSSYKNANGEWLTQKDIYYDQVPFSNNDDQAYANSSVNDLLEYDYLHLIDSKLQPYILTPTLPIAAGALIDATTITKKVFLLSITEIGATTLNNDGSKLSYFSDNNSRIAYYQDSPKIWWTRSPCSFSSDYVYCVFTDGGLGRDNTGLSRGVRPTFIVDSSLLVDDDGYIHFLSPVISSSLGTSGTDLGEKKDVFNVTYSVSDPNGNNLTITERIDNININTRTNISSGSSLTFSKLNDFASFQTILNGKHTLEIIADNGDLYTSFTFTFTKKVTEADITLKEALAVEGDISVAVLKIEGSIPEDAIVTALVTNNGKDPSPVWQDATLAVLNNKNIVFTNKENTNGAAFNFKVKIKRGPSDKGGYITSINGVFQ